MIKLIIAGGRNFDDYALLRTTLDNLLSKTDYRDCTIISGCAKGADRLGERYAHDYLMEIWKMPADWNTHGKAAGYIRNKEMAEVATHCVCFWDGDSKGTKHMIDLAKQYNLILRVIMYD